jgi:murein peptide amidase A
MMQETIDLEVYNYKAEQLFLAAGFIGESICETSSGSIFVWLRKSNASNKTVYISAGIHGDEPAGPLAIIEFLQQGLSEKINWIICPILNPTGIAAGTRENDQRIDLNRDYYEYSSKEIQSHVAWLKKQKTPDVFISLHEDWETTGFYFYEINLHHDNPERAKTLLANVETEIIIEPSFTVDNHETRELGWIHHAADADLPDLWPEAIFLAKHGCPLSFTFETPSKAVSLEKRIKAHVIAITTAIEISL